jgi:hypothetical protein
MSSKTELSSMNFMFMRPCIVNVFKHNQQDEMLHNGVFTVNALHVSGGSSAHHQELKTVYTASGICQAFLLLYFVDRASRRNSC